MSVASSECEMARVPMVLFERLLHGRIAHC